MGWFDKITNPAWSKIQSLKPQEAFEMASVLLLHGFLRKLLRDEFLTPLEKLGDPNVPAEIMNEAFRPIFVEIRQVLPMNAALRERLVDEIEIGFLTTSIGKPVGRLKMVSFNSEMMIEGVGCLALAEINSRLARKEPCTLTKSGYSQDPDECRVQVILAWMRLIGLRNAKLTGLMSQLYFEKNWQLACENALSGFSNGLERISRDIALDRAKQECKSLSPQGNNLISYLCDRIVKGRTNRT